MMCAQLHSRQHSRLKRCYDVQQAVDPEAETEDDSDRDNKPENGVKDRVSKALGGTATRAVERISKRVRSTIIMQNWQSLLAVVYDTACPEDSRGVYELHFPFPL